MCIRDSFSSFLVLPHVPLIICHPHTDASKSSQALSDQYFIAAIGVVKAAAFHFFFRHGVVSDYSCHFSLTAPHPASFGWHFPLLTIKALSEILASLVPSKMVEHIIITQRQVSSHRQVRSTVHSLCRSWFSFLNFLRSKM